MIKDLLIALFLIVLAIAFRTIWHIGPNFELVTGACLAAGYFIENKRLVFAVPVIILLISDSIIGNSSIFLFTWSAYILTAVLGLVLQKAAKVGLFKKFFYIEGLSFLSVIIFFLWTNLGVVLVSNMYPKTILGLMASYINALPFVKTQLVSVVLLTPLIFLFVVFLRKLELPEGIIVRKPNLEINIHNKSHI